MFDNVWMKGESSSSKKGESSSSKKGESSSLQKKETSEERTTRVANELRREIEAGEVTRISLEKVKPTTEDIWGRRTAKHDLDNGWTRDEVKIVFHKGRAAVLPEEKCIFGMECDVCKSRRALAKEVERKEMKEDAEAAKWCEELEIHHHPR